MNNTRNLHHLLNRSIAFLLTLALFFGLAEPAAYAGETCEHQYVPTEYVQEPTCTEYGFRAYVCSVCGDVQPWEIKDPLGHAWDEGKIVVEPTETTEGAAVYTCTRCGAQNPVFLPALGEKSSTTPSTDAVNDPPVPDTSVDLEGAPLWEIPFRELMLTGNWASDFLTVVKTQMWYAESEKNFDPVWNAATGSYDLHGYTRYGAWYGLPYGDWCAMFLSFCLKYAGVPQEVIPWEASSENWAAALAQKGLFGARDSYTPKAGDLIFFDDDRNGFADHCGVVTQADLSAGMVYTVEGNRTDDVRNFSYSAYDSTILGYGILPENPDPRPHLALEPVPETGEKKADLTEEKTAPARITADLGSFLPDASVPEGTTLGVIPVDLEADAASAVQSFVSESFQAEPEEIALTGYTVYLALPDNTVAPVGAEVTLYTSLPLPAVGSSDSENEILPGLKKIAAVYVKDGALCQLPAEAAAESGVITSVTFHVPEAATFALCYTSEAAVEEKAEETLNPKEADKKEPAEDGTKEEIVAFRDEAEVADGKITVTAGEGILAEGVKLQVIEPSAIPETGKLMAAPKLRAESLSPAVSGDSSILREAAKASESSAEGEASASDEEENTRVVVARYEYEISLLDADGNPTQPAGDVTLRFSLPEAQNVNLTAQVYHQTEEGSVNLKTTLDTDSGEVVAVTNGFSTFLVEFSYRKNTFILAQGKSATLNEVFSNVGMRYNIGETITDAYISAGNENLISIDKSNSAFGAEGWRITPNANLSQADLQQTATLTIKTGVSILSFIPANEYQVTIKVSEEQDDVPYLERNDNDRVGSTQTHRGCIRVSEGGNMPTEFDNGWYLFRGTIDYGGRITVRGSDVHFILADDCSVTARGGVHIEKGAHLTICGQAKESGELRCTMNGGSSSSGFSIGDYFGISEVRFAAGIGGNRFETDNNGKLTIKSGTVITVGGVDGGAGIGSGIGGTFGEITIYGGKISATGCNGAGIGSGREAPPTGTITIKGGTVNASGGEGNGAGIGGGKGDGTSYGFGNIVINGGTVTAQGGKYAAGIGFGHRNMIPGSVTITGGTVTATGGKSGAGIGGSEDRSGCDVSISGGAVTATSGGYAAGIGGGEEGHQGGKVTISGGTVTAVGKNNGAGIGGGGQETVGITHWAATCNGGPVEITGGTVTVKSSLGTGIGAGFHGKNGPITISGGNVTAEAGVQKQHIGDGAAIGSYRDQGDPITINGGTVIAKSLSTAAGIGGGHSSHGGVVTINGGHVIAFSVDGAGIGGGSPNKESAANSGGSGGTVTINGGEVYATSAGRGAGIGGGHKGNGGSLTVTNGSVFATSGDLFYDWFTQNKSMAMTTSFTSNGYLNLVASGIVALIGLLITGDYGGAGIGGGHGGNGGTVKITGGTVVANAKLSGAAAIGRGKNGGNDGTLKIYDEASVDAGATLTKAQEADTIKKEDREKACRSNLAAIISICDHGGGSDKAVTERDKNARVHEVICPYCYTKGKNAETGHVFDPKTHTCICGHKEVLFTVQTEGNGTVSAVIPGEKDENLKSGDYVSTGETIKITAVPAAGSNAVLTASYTQNGRTETVKPSGSVKKDNTLENTYVMPTADLLLKGTFTTSQPPQEETLAPILITFTDGTQAGRTVVLRYSNGEILTLPDADEIPQEDGPAVKFTHPYGLLFDGWKTNDGSDVFYDPGETFTAEKDTTFVAQWEEAYSVWVGGVQITEDNAYDVLGDGKVRFYPTYDENSGKYLGGVLALDSPEGLSDTWQDSLIYASGVDLRVEGSGSISGKGDAADPLYGIRMDGAGSLSLSGNLTITAKNGISAAGEILFAEDVSRIEVKEASGTAVSGGDIRLDEALFIRDPANGKVQNGQITDAEGNDAHRVLIVPREHLYVRLDWNDGNQTQLRPDSVTVCLGREGTVVSSAAVKNNSESPADLLMTPAKNDVIYEIDGENNPVAAGGIAVFNGRKYLVRQASSSDHTVLLVNTLISDDPVTGMVEWDDQDNFDLKRPASVKVRLLADGSIADTQDVSPDADGHWTWRFDNLPQYREDGDPITYSAAAEPVEDYRILVNGSVANGFRITYSYRYVNLTVTKNWVPADPPTALPGELKLRVKPNGRDPDGIDFTLTAANAVPGEPLMWCGAVRDADGNPLPKYDKAGNRIIYTVTEEVLPESEYKLTGTTINSTSTTLTNTFGAAASSQTIAVFWDDADDQDGFRPTELRVSLMNGEEEKRSLRMKALNEYGLDEDGLNDWWFAQTDPVEDAEYSWDIEMPDGYDLSYAFTDGLVTYAVLCHEPETVTITVRKVWDDYDNWNDHRPDSLLVSLLADGNAVDAVFLEEAEQEESGGGSWEYTFEDLPRKEKGGDIAYTVAEDEISGYTGSVDKSVNGDEILFTLTNTAADSVILIPPEGITGLVYNAKEQVLVKPGTAGGGTMGYSLNPGGPFTETIPVGTDAGEYHVYFRVIGDETHEDSDVYGPVTVTIGKALLTDGALAETQLTYNGKDQQVTVIRVKAGDLDVPLSAVTVSGNVAREVGRYKVTVTALENSNFRGSVEVWYYILEESFTGYYYDTGDTTRVWQKGSRKDAVFHVRRADLDEYTYRLFRRVEVDDNPVSRSDFKTAEGSIIITFGSDYMENLSVGWHKLTTVFNDGEVSTDFLVIPQNDDGREYPNPYPGSTGYTYVSPTNNPRTGDDSSIALWGVAALLSALAAASGLGILRRRRKREKS